VTASTSNQHSSIALDSELDSDNVPSGMISTVGLMKVNVVVTIFFHRL
jgi:hypothetical protein